MFSIMCRITELKEKKAVAASEWSEDYMSGLNLLHHKLNLNILSEKCKRQPLVSTHLPDYFH